MVPAYSAYQNRNLNCPLAAGALVKCNIEIIHVRPFFRGKASDIIHLIPLYFAVRLCCNEVEIRPSKTGGSNNVSATKDKIKVLVVDDHPVVRKGLQSCLARQERLRIVGEAADGPEAVRCTRELEPDVVLLDIDLPGLSGLEVTQILRKEAPKVKILVLSVHTNKEYVFRILQAGAHGYVSKEASPDELLDAIESVASGEVFYAPQIAQAALNEFVTSGGKPFVQLTNREREVLALIAEGQSNKEVAQQLGIGVRTIETHRERIMEKLDIHTIAGLTRFAILNGVISLEQPRESMSQHSQG
jgi:two-component system, NarL family, nitrate/nitrite response regulator NarL